MSRRTDPYERLLRWYPKTWRDTNGAVFVDTLREQSEHDGRTRPSVGEAFAARTNGLGLRLDARLAMAMAVTAVALVAIGQLVAEAQMALALAAPDRLGVGPFTTTTALIVNYLGVTALVAAAAVVPAARAAGVISGPKSVLVLLVGTIGLVLAVLAQHVRSMGPDRADPNGPFTAWLVLTAAAVALGLVAAAVFLASLLGHTALGRGPRLALTGIASVIAVPALVEVGILDQQIWVAVGLVVVAVSLRSRGAWPASRGPRSAPGRRPLIRALAAVSALIGVVGIAYALTGAAWSPVAADGTAGAQAVVVCLAAAIPLLVAWASSTARGPSPSDVWGPTLVACLAIGITIYAYASPSGTPEPGLYLASAVLAAALAWRAAAVVEGTPQDRWIAGTAVALACLGADGAALLPVAAFVTPFVAAVVAVRGGLGRRRSPTDRPQAATAED